MKKLVALMLAVCMLLACTAAMAETYHVGILQLMQHNALDAATKGFRDALTELLGDDVVFDEQNAQGESAQCSTIATSFVANSYDLIMANATPALLACMNATDSIPVLATSITDYASAMDYETVEGGTGINVSGTSDGVTPSMYVKCVLDFVPNAKKVAIVYCSAEPNSKVQSDGFIAACEPYGIECTVATFADSNDMQAVIAAAIEGMDALYIPTDNTAASNMTTVANVCLAANMPVICGEENMTGIGGLATVSISYYGLGYTTGKMAYEILANGADISTMEIQYAETLVKKYNAEYAEAIGITIPEGYEAIVAE